MSLELYKKKRNFAKTMEPKGQQNTANNNFVYVVQKHAASHLHYDFRLAFEGVLKSWAIPKGPSLNPNNKRLAVEVEDHPLEYAEFEGTIPKEEYGGGVVMIWDNGIWEPITNPQEGFSNGKLTFYLYGSKLKGEWSLVKIKGSKSNWLLVKKADKYANYANDSELLESPSVKSGRSLSEIVNNRNSKTDKNNLSVFNGGIVAPMPLSLAPQLATLVDTIPQEPGWIFEIKFDGYRILTFIKNQKIKLLTRNGNDWTNKFPFLTLNLNKLPVTTAILDGEIVILDKKGISSFQSLQNAITEGKSNAITYYLFDILYFNGQDIRNIPLISRKKILENLLKKSDSLNIKFSEHLEGEADVILQEACNLNLEGIIAKRENSSYRSERNYDWLKLKCKNRQEFIVGGYTSPQGNRSFFGSLLIGYYDQFNKLIYGGRVGTGFDQKSLKLIFEKMQPLRQNKTPFYKLANIPEVRNANWVSPQLVTEIEFTGWTDALRLRHPSFKGLREDKPAKEIKRETPKYLDTSNFSEVMTINKIKLSHPNKLFFPAIKITKLNLANYYQEHAEIILPHLINRPLTILRCPEGIDHNCFIQKHIESLPPSVGKVTIEEKDAIGEHIVIKDLGSIITLIQFGALELHTWNCLTNSLNNPDRIIFDLDPAPEVEFSRVKESAQILRTGLEVLGLTSFVKTSGKKGLHVCIPLDDNPTWEEIKSFAYKIAKHMAKLAPNQFIARLPKKERTDKIFIDYLRNERGATCISAFSTRRTPEASISTPIHWDELQDLNSANQFTILNLGKRLKSLKSDPWEGFFEIKQSIKSLSFD